MENTESTVELLLLKVMDEMLEGFQVIGSDWRYRYVNETVARQGHTTKGELVGRTMMECYPGIEHTEVFAQCKQCMETQESVRMENKFIFPGGDEGWFQLYIHPVADGVLILSVDITEKKKADELLREKIHEVDILLNATTDREVKLSELRSEVATLKSLAQDQVAA